MSWLDDLKGKLAKAVIDGFAGLTPDLCGIDRIARDFSRGEWQAIQTSAVAVGGGLFTALPGLHFAGLVPDLLLLVNRMAVCSYGIGAIAAKENGLGFILEDEDMPAILARWAGVDCLNNAAIAKMGGIGGMALAGQPVGTMFAKAAVSHSGILVGKKIGGKVGAKVAAKFMGKYGGKLVGGMFPFIGPAICGGINVWFITEMCMAASGWYSTKMRYMS